VKKKERYASLSELMTSRTLYRARRVMRHVPREPRCKLCHAPFRGVGALLRFAGFGPSRKNPNFCNSCFERAPLGGEQMEVGVLFADVRGFTAMAEAMEPEAVEQMLSAFYRAATDILMGHNAIIDKMVGDQVMALFVPLFAGEGHQGGMVSAGEELLRAVGVGAGDQPGLPLGVGIDFGTAFVGNVGHGDVWKDFTALGDVVNTAERLQAKAGPGQLVLSERVREAVKERFPDALKIEFELKGKSALVAAWVIDVGAVSFARPS
jgi:adenylate cyclase